MSEYADYNFLSKSYDKGRSPIAADIIASLITSLVNQKDPCILDAGCGTAQYLETFVKHGYKNITLMDASPGMISKASEKAKFLQERQPDLKIKLELANITELPFKANSFDAVIINNVIHHLEPHPDGKHFPNINKMVSELGRVLKPGGIISIMTATPDQQDAIWYSHLMPTVLERLKARLPDSQTMEKIVSNNNLVLKHRINYMGPDNWIQKIDSPEAVLDAEWRKLDSFWALASDEETKELEETLSSLQASKQLFAFYKKHNHQDKFGIMTIFLIGKNQQ